MTQKFLGAWRASFKKSPTKKQKTQKSPKTLPLPFTPNHKEIGISGRKADGRSVGTERQAIPALQRQEHLSIPFLHRRDTRIRTQERVQGQQPSRKTLLRKLDISAVDLCLHGLPVGNRQGHTAHRIGGKITDAIHSAGRGRLPHKLGAKGYPEELAAHLCTKGTVTVSKITATPALGTASAPQKDDKANNKKQKMSNFQNSSLHIPSASVSAEASVFRSIYMKIFSLSCKKGIAIFV